MKKALFFLLLTAGACVAAPAPLPKKKCFTPGCYAMSLDGETFLVHFSRGKDVYLGWERPDRGGGTFVIMAWGEWSCDKSTVTLRIRGGRPRPQWSTLTFRARSTVALVDGRLVGLGLSRSTLPRTVE